MGEVEELRGFLTTRCPDLHIEDDDIKKLVAQGFRNEFSFGGVSMDELREVLPGRLGVVRGLFKVFGEPQLPAGMS